MTYKKAFWYVMFLQATTAAIPQPTFHDQIRVFMAQIISFGVGILFMIYAQKLVDKLSKDLWN